MLMELSSPDTDYQLIGQLKVLMVLSGYIRLETLGLRKLLVSLVLMQIQLPVIEPYGSHLYSLKDLVIELKSNLIRMVK